jgi:hypothetical protein
MLYSRQGWKKENLNRTFFELPVETWAYLCTKNRMSYLGERRKTMENIIVGIIAVITVGAGIWSWWMENGRSSEENSEKEDRKKK